MAFRGMGGFGGGGIPIFLQRRPRYARAGDIFDDISSTQDTSGLDTSGTSPDLPVDFSDVSGGSSTTIDPTFTTMGLGDIGSALGPYLGGVGKSIFSPTLKDLVGAAGSAAAAGQATNLAQVAGSRLGKHVRRLLGGGGGRAHRRMNPGNFKALRRSMRRLKSFETAARHVVHFTHPKPTARVKFKFHRKRRR